MPNGFIRHSDADQLVPIGHAEDLTGRLPQAHLPGVYRAR